jgi:cell wall-associated NlpC family hydrolase
VVLAAVLAPAVGHAEPAPADVDHQLAAASQELDVIVEQFNVAQDRLQRTTAQLSTIRAQLPPLEVATDQAQDKVGEIAAGAYRSGGVATVTALLAADSPGTLMDQLTVLGHLESERSREVQALLSTRYQYQKEQRTLTVLADAQRAQAVDLANRRSQIESRIAALQQLQARSPRWRAAVRSARADAYVPLFSPDRAGAAVRFAYSQLGKWYRYATEGPNTYDCSGLTKAAWRAAGVGLPHSAAQQRQTTHPVSREQLRPGDLVFYYRDIHHVAIYVGDGRVIDAPQTGEQVTMRGMDYAPIAGYGRPA